MVEAYLEITLCFGVFHFYHCKVASSRLSQLVAHSRIVYEGEI